MLRGSRTLHAISVGCRRVWIILFRCYTQGSRYRGVASIASTASALPVERQDRDVWVVKEDVALSVGSCSVASA